MRRLIALRRATPALGTGASVEVLSDGYPFVYLRGGSHLVVINGRRDEACADVGTLARDARPLAVHGVGIDGGKITAAGFSYGIFAL